MPNLSALLSALLLLPSLLLRIGGVDLGKKEDLRGEVMLLDGREVGEVLGDEGDDEDCCC